MWRDARRMQHHCLSCQMRAFLTLRNPCSVPGEGRESMGISRHGCTGALLCQQKEMDKKQGGTPGRASPRKAPE